MERPKILLADNDAQVRETTRAVLELAGFEVLSTATLKEAIEAFAGREFAVVIVDYSSTVSSQHVLPGVFKFARPGIRTVLFSGHPAAEEMRDDFDEVIAKPVSPAVLVDTIRRLLGIDLQRRAVAMT